MNPVAYALPIEARVWAAFAPAIRWLYRRMSLDALNDLQATVEAAGIQPSYHVNPEQDIWRQMDQIRLKLVAA